MYILSLTPTQFDELYELLVEHEDLHPALIKSVLESMGNAKDHYNERQTVLCDLLGLSILNPHH